MTLDQKIAFARAQISDLVAAVKKTDGPERLDALIADISQWWQELARLEELNEVVYGV